MNIIKKIGLLTFSCVISHLGLAQKQPIFNGNFQFIDYSGIPKGWSWGFTKDQAKQYDVSVDSTATSPHKYMVSLARKGSDGEFGVISYCIPQTFKGKEITLRGFLKTENVTNFAGLWLRIDGFDGTLAFDNMETQKVSGTTDFNEYSITLPYDDQKALKIYTGVLLAGGGRLQVKNMQLFIDGKPIDQVSLKPVQLKRAQTDTAFSKSSKLDLITADRQQLSNLAQLGKFWGFIKYYHPNVANGNFNMDAELFRLLPKVMNCLTNDQLSDTLELWFNNLGEAERCEACTSLSEKDVLIRPEFNEVINNRILKVTLQKKLQYLLLHHASQDHYYVSIADHGTGGPVFNERAYAFQTMPDVGYRLLALFRYWNMIEYFYPDKHLTENNWNDVLVEYIPRFISASTETSYALTTLSLIACIHDTHANIWYNSAIENFKGKYGLPYQIRFIENKPTVTNYYDEGAKAAQELKIGDVITAINGSKISELLEKYLPYTPASNYEAQLRDISHNFLMRSNDPQFNLEIVRDGVSLHILAHALENVKINYNIDINPEPTAPAYKLMPGNIGYIFPGRYKNNELPAIKKLFKSTRGIIVDMRCYPSDFMPFTFVPFIKTGDSKFVRFTTGSVVNPGTFKTSFILSTKGENVYKGKVVVIVNEYTQSQAEYTTMAFQSASNVKVIGSTTAGADGNICEIILPGGIKTYMSGIGVLYPDGTETQRKGVKLDEIIKPTLTGIMSGRDELLEKAEALISEK